MVITTGSDAVIDSDKARTALARLPLRAVQLGGGPIGVLQKIVCRMDVATGRLNKIPEI